MKTKTNISVLKIVLIAALPFTAHAYEFGPLPGYTGAPGDNPTACVNAGCHSGTVNSGPGGVKIILPSGNSGTYTPGQSMQLLVQITDATEKSFGFELTARSGAGNNAQAGVLAPADANTQTICADGTMLAAGAACPAQSPIEYIEHNLTGYMNSIQSGSPFTYTINWTPPATAAGNVTLFVAANAGSGTRNVFGTHVYTSNLTLTPAVANTGAPTINTNGVVPIYSTSTTIQPTSWISIYGTNLGTATTTWNGTLPIPTSLGGTSVSINGKPALLWIVLHDPVNNFDQINCQAPDDSGTGSVAVTVTTPTGTASSTVTLAPSSPSFSRLDAKYPAAIVLTPGAGNSGGGYDIIGPVSHFSYATRPVKKGETVVLFGVGFGPTNPGVPAGQLPPSTGAPVVTPPRITVGGVPAVVDFAGIVEAGLYQLNVEVPANAASGDQILQAEVGGVITPANLLLTVQ